MITYSESELKFLQTMEECRVATSHSDIPHVKPVSYIFDSGKFLIATDYDTRMYKNLVKNPKAALTVDIYQHGGHKALVIQGDVTIVEKGEMFSKIFQKFHEKFDWVRNEPWDENEAPFVVISPFNKTSWGV